MNTSPIDAALEALAPHLLTPQEPMFLRNVLEDLHDSAQDALLAELIGSTEAAVLWSVGERQARRIIAELAVSGQALARQLSDGSWIIRRSDVVRHTPRPVGRPKQRE